MKKLSKSVVSIFMTIVIVISILPMSAFAASYNMDYWNHPIPGRTLYKGCSSGRDVKWLQCALNELIIRGDKDGIHLKAPNINVDGVFRESTKTALLTFQSRYYLANDGKFGPASRSKMLSVLRYYNPTPIPQPDPGPTYSAVDPNVKEGVYYIRNKHTNKYLDVKGGINENNAEIVQFPFHGDSNQQFEIRYENGFYKIYTKLGGESRCLDLSSPSEADSNGTHLKIYKSYDNCPQQNFRFRVLGDGSVEIGSVCSYGNKVLEVMNSSYADCATVQIWQCDNYRINDDWYLEPVNYSNTSINKVRQAQMNVKSKKQYDSIDDAAKDFIMAYDGMSVAQNREYGTSIVQLGNGKYTFTHIIWGPFRGESNEGDLGGFWKEINIYEAIAYVHTHGKKKCDANLVFSYDDMDVCVDQNGPMQYAYVGNAYGEIYKYTKNGVKASDADIRRYGTPSGDKLDVNFSRYVSHYLDDTDVIQAQVQGSAEGILRLG